MNRTAETVFITSKMLVGLTDLFVEFLCLSLLYKIGMVLLINVFEMKQFFRKLSVRHRICESFFCWKSVDRFIAILSSNVNVFMPVILIQHMTHGIKSSLPSVRLPLFDYFTLQ
jgi:hypothetical protein